MKPVSGKRMAQLAERRGWELKRIKGSHHVFVKDGREERLVIPTHGNRSLKLGHQRALMKLIPVAEEHL